MGCHLVAAQYPLDQQLYFATGRLFAKQAGIDDFGVVEDHEIPGLEEAWEVSETSVNRCGIRAIQ
jgi:hypothetical protein